MAELAKDLAEISPDKINQIAEEKGKLFAEGTTKQQGKGRLFVVKTNQIRNVFGHINSIRTEYKKTKEWNDKIGRELILLKPKLAYAAGRNPDVKGFQEFMFQAIDGVINSPNQKEALENFFALIESVVAYHKFYGGKDK